MKGKGALFWMIFFFFVGFEFFTMCIDFFSKKFLQRMGRRKIQVRENVYTLPSNMNVSELKSGKKKLLKLETLLTETVREVFFSISLNKSKFTF